MTYPSNQTRHLSSWQSACLVEKKKKSPHNVTAAVKKLNISGTRGKIFAMNGGLNIVFS